MMIKKTVFTQGNDDGGCGGGGGGVGGGNSGNNCLYYFMAHHRSHDETTTMMATTTKKKSEMNAFPIILFESTGIMAIILQIKICKKKDKLENIAKPDV
ncbi:hypothetical protein DERF_000159 [Dermatophagoides farinae]|uniref:Transmembrane protein n=1 Tax=Dermatophagoides farinae TaxID=6954 RepID=A0A922I815_DERFA|nr:hypothetical protein DERF_000159 [Dermatophagoides farinae]